VKDAAPTLSVEEIRHAVLDHLKGNAAGQLAEVVNAVAVWGVTQGRLRLPSMMVPSHQYSQNIPRVERDHLFETCRQFLWQLLVQGVLVFGKDIDNPNFPFFRLTQYGEESVKSGGPHPADPDGFLKEFLRENQTADPVVIDYLTEAIRAFNANCIKSCLVMIGCVSEKLFLQLLDAFEVAITDVAKKTAFQKDCRQWQVFSKYKVLMDRLELMAQAKKLPGPLKDIVRVDMSGMFDLFRRHRNNAGHPELPSTEDRNTAFMHIRVITDYTRKMHLLIAHFASNPADW